MDKVAEKILRRRMHGLYLSRSCGDLTRLAHELLGMHCWFHRNVAFSAVIRGAELAGWKHALTKTWLYRGTLHGVPMEDLPDLLALHAGEGRWEAPYREIAERAMRLMEDGVYSRAEMRRIFAGDYDQPTIDRALSPWGGVFCELARMGKVAFRDMTSRDFDLIDAEPVKTVEQVLPELLNRFFAAYGPATLNDAAWFFGLRGADRQRLSALNLEGYERWEYEGKTYYSMATCDESDIPELTLLSGFDPYIVSYAERSMMLPDEYKREVILKSGICLPAIAVNGQVAGLWNIKKGEPEVAFFKAQPSRIRDEAWERVCSMIWRTAGRM